jgi:regulator of protease activity HflC (stomatin/prohibitin superfamily)
MKNLMLFLTVALLATSCYDFNREQDRLDRENEGKGILMKARYEKQASIEEAKAKLESSKMDAKRRILLSEAEIEKAKAEAKATIIRAEAEKQQMEILAEAFGGKDNYVTYMKYRVMYSGKGNKYFVATEGSLPIMFK